MSMLMASYQISVVNDGTQATPTNFQQLIQTTLQYPSGVRFWSPTDGWLYGWLESLSSTNQAVIWVKIPSSIPAGGVYQIYMVENSSLNFDGVYWGEAPQLSSTYAQYDNGANVFNNYWNFAGTTISSIWTQVVPSGTTTTQNNGITITTNSSSTYGGLILTNGFTGTQILEGDVTAVSGVAAGLALQTGNSASSDGYDFNYWNGSVANGSMSVGLNATNNPNLQVSTGIMGGVWVSSSLQVWYKNYVATPGNQTVYTLPSTIYPSIGIYCCSGSTSITFQWLRTRAYPPNGVMPSVSFGASQYSGELITVTVP